MLPRQQPLQISDRNFPRQWLRHVLGSGLVGVVLLNYHCS